ncbi:MAG: TetR/AcrR family transcriptional regulator, partial [Paracoccaceae bacterium]
MSTTTKNRSAMAQETMQRLISTAQHAFAEQGFAAVSLDAIALQSGVTRGALHHHFTNKAGLFEAVLRSIDAALCATLDTVHAAHPDPWAAFRACCHAYLAESLQPDRRRILFQDAPMVLGLKAVDILMESGFGPMVTDLQELVRDGRILPLDPEATGHLLNGAIMNLAF